jgi:hypothetical protein
MATAAAESSATATADVDIGNSAFSEAESGFTADPTTTWYAEARAASVSEMVANGERKWEPITPVTTIWTDVTNPTNTWTPINSPWRDAA